MARVKNLPLEEREIPHEPGNFLSFRRLTADEDDEAQAASVKETIERYGPEAMKMLAGMDVPEQAKQAKEAGPLAGYSPKALVQLGLGGWRGPLYPEEEFGDTSWSELDPRTRAWAAEQVLDINGLLEGEGLNSVRGIGVNGTETARETASAGSGSPS